MTAYVSLFDLFSVGIGPSSSHTVGPMRAAGDFVERLRADGLIDDALSITCSLYGSLGATGLGHGTPDAIVAGLEGLDPETCDPQRVHGSWSGLVPGSSTALRDAGFLELATVGIRPTISLGGTHTISMQQSDVSFEPYTRLPQHPNAMTLTAWGDESGLPIASETYYSVGGGFIQRHGEPTSSIQLVEHPLSFSSAAALLELCERNGVSIAEIAWRIESELHGADAVLERLDLIWNTMEACISAGMHSEGTLPGGLGVPRRASQLRERLEREREAGTGDHDTSTEWLHAYALAVNEENASGGRVVTAPTNGAAGIIPAVGRYYLDFVRGADRAGIHRYLLTATAIGSLFKSNASISGAEAGCQGEVGSACAMACGALCAVLGGTPRQVENAAEIAMEHHLGLTCDPVGGLVQVPCIERNAIASSTAVSAARLAMHGDGTHLVSLDMVIETMRQTGVDMSTKYKETSEGGLAVNVIEC
ncbi:L-serine ammonia-lyase [Agreia sp. COWG]|uniref:L-serine ammonia-lyase n=1 Tax=Agreia sp. COWG TaxID=2773266 RepID=UPI001929413A|nr:L-serine ammonia-lyase [Agreia sp. COWG]CAD6002749.1 L-serine dehydratase [Agreia sp. COWG]